MRLVHENAEEFADLVQTVRGPSPPPRGLAAALENAALRGELVVEETVEMRVG